MTEIIQYIISNWTEWLFVGISGFLGYGYKQLLKRQKEEAQKNEALHDGMQALLRDRIIQAYNHYQDKGFCPIYGKENVKRMYDAYHVLGGNDVATQLKDTLIKMPEEPMEREEYLYGDEHDHAMGIVPVDCHWSNGFCSICNYAGY